MGKFIAGGLASVLGLLVFASSAFASSHNPTGEFAQFAECPLNRATITDCVYSLTDGGYVTLGKKTVPINKPASLQGGFEGEGSEVKFYGAENGDTLSKTPQSVPGGLIGVTAPTWWPKFLQNWFNGLIEEGLTGVDATIELVGPSKGLTNIKLSTENLLLEEGIALGLPAKIHLENATLGSNCYIGSDLKPIQVNLTTGTDGALTGAAGEFTFNEAFTVISLTDSRIVNNSFAAPAASGCGGLFALFVDPLVNTLVGLPAGSGENSAVLEADFQDGYAEAVKASE
ncbi:MAG TPA: hypothetical protein VMS60_07110 [Solirubrobacterales bacterium]|nr:hypothetical protein [Solirubrobacterales bacterium]